MREGERVHAAAHKHQNASMFWSSDTCVVTNQCGYGSEHLLDFACTAVWTMRLKHQNISCCVKTVLFCQFRWVTLTCTHSFFVPRLVRAVVTVQSLVVVAHVCLVAHLAHLPGAGLAAVTAVHEEAHTRRTGRGEPGTLTGPLAVLRPVVRVCSRGCDGCGRRHGSGILGVGLERGKPKLSLEVSNTTFKKNKCSLVQPDAQPIFKVSCFLCSTTHSFISGPSWMNLHLKSATVLNSSKNVANETSSMPPSYCVPWVRHWDLLLRQRKVDVSATKLYILKPTGNIAVCEFLFNSHKDRIKTRTIFTIKTRWSWSRHHIHHTVAATLLTREGGKQCIGQPISSVYS